MKAVSIFASCLTRRNKHP